MPRAPPQQRVVGRQPGGEAPGVVEQDAANSVDAPERANLDPVHLADRLEPAVLSMPDEGVGGVEIGGGGRRRRVTIERLGDPQQQRQ